MQSHYKRLTDPQWEIIKEYLPIQRKRIYSLRSVVDAIFWYLRLGAHGVARRWRNLPDNFPDWRSVYSYFRKWKSQGTLENLNFALNRLERERKGKGLTPAMFCIAERPRILHLSKQLLL